MYTVLRIEDTQGRGLYNFGCYMESLAARLDKHFSMSASPHQPSPGNDGLHEIHYLVMHRYAFRYMHHLLNWIKDCSIQELYDNGGVITVVEVEKIERGGRQCHYDEQDVISKRVLTLQDFQKEYPHVVIFRPSLRPETAV